MRGEAWNPAGTETLFVLECEKLGLISFRIIRLKPLVQQTRCRLEHRTVHIVELPNQRKNLPEQRLIDIYTIV